MTPLASRLFRETDNPAIRSALASAQFFECSALFEMAREMVTADLDTGCLAYSEFAQLPAPITVIEFPLGDSRLAFICLDEKGAIGYTAFSEWRGNVQYWFECGFRPGTGENQASSWNEDVARWWAASSGLTVEKFAPKQATGMNALLEKLLCMINQPGLVERRQRPIDKRVQRLAAKAPECVSPPAIWHECRIRAGQHGGANTNSLPEEAARPLHYVRKHFKPSVNKWIEGYWRGDIALGLHLKWYSPQVPEKRVLQ
jgi:hypothetical protein